MGINNRLVQAAVLRRQSHRIITNLQSTTFLNQMFYREANKTHTATTQGNETKQLVDTTVQNQAATSPDTWQLISAASCCTRSSWQLKQAHVCTKTVASAHDRTVERFTAAIKKNHLRVNGVAIHTDATAIHHKPSGRTSVPVTKTPLQSKWKFISRML
jgi:hypothetical protein